MTDAESLQLFIRSMTRCISAPLFLDRFYARFLLSDDRIAARFAKVDLKRQAAVLRASLYHVLRAAEGSPEGIAHLDDIARSHGERGYDIGAQEYAHWLDCLVAVAKEIDSTFDEAVELAWRLHLGRAIDVMVRRHRATE